MIADAMRVGQGILPVDGELRMVGGTGGPARDALAAGGLATCCCGEA